jgi:hypothetical protein
MKTWSIQEAARCCAMFTAVVLVGCSGEQTQEPTPHQPPIEPTCTDGVKNGAEVDVDCGGPTCPGCPEGAACAADADCLSGSCAVGRCVPAQVAVSCDNGIRDGLETDIDCGGADCPTCPYGYACVRDEDCGWVSCLDGLCGGYRSCANWERDGHETDTDCGGPFCHGCEAGRSCRVDSDCLSEECVAGSCTVPSTASCHNGVRDGNESDVDCGGGLCPSCSDGLGCNTLMDCETPTCEQGICGGTWVCSNLMQDGRETDVDCGGGLCPPCTGGLACVSNDDCLSELCADGICTARALTCDNGVKDGRETDVDCGASCDPCQLGQGCARVIDCTTLACTGGVCGSNLLTLQSGPASMSCSQSGTVVVQTGVSLFGLAVVSDKLTLDGGRVGFWVQQAGALVSPADGRFAGIYVEADAALAAGVERYAEVALLADHVEEDCHSQLRVTAGSGSIAVTPDFMLFASTTQLASEALMNGGDPALTEPYEGVEVVLDNLAVIDVTGFEGPQAPGAPSWWLKLEGNILVANDFGIELWEPPAVGDRFVVTGYVVQRQGVYLLLAHSLSTNSFLP